jgi:hypothetical protein
MKMPFNAAVIERFRKDHMYGSPVASQIQLIFLFEGISNNANG